MLNFRKTLKASFALAALVLSTSASLYSQCCNLEPVSEISLSGGWRRDNFKTKAENYETTTNNLGENPVIATRLRWEEELQLKNLDIWQIGGKLQFGFPDCFCDCDYSWLSQFYVKGYYYYGWVSNGKLYDNVYDNSNFELSAKTHKGRTNDGSIALGYLIPVCDNFGIAPIGGWAYHQLRVDFKDSILDGESARGIDKRFKSTWKGPWLGVDAVYYMDWCGTCLRFDFGYEYHWGKWSGKRDIANGFVEDCYYFEDTRHSNKVQGQVGYLTAWWPVCDCWEVGLGVNYNYFKARKGNLVPSQGIEIFQNCNPEVIPTGTTYSYEARNKDTIWRSVGVTLDLGYRF